MASIAATSRDDDGDVASDITPSIIVVGGGLAGASAALEAADALREQKQGGKVLLLDKEGRVGGNSAKASSGLSAVAAAEDDVDVVGRPTDIDDSTKLFESDLLASAQGRGDPRLARALAEDSPLALPWIRSRLGVDLPTLSRLGGHSTARTHGPEGGAPIGFMLMRAATAALEGDELVEVRPGAKVVGLETEGEKVAGVVVEVAGVVEEREQGKDNKTETTKTIITLPADAVILATGGYASSKELLSRYAPQALAASGGGRTTNGAWATGDAISLTRSSSGTIKAKLVDLDAVQLHPTAFSPPVVVADASSSSAFLAPERLRGVGGVLVDGTGKRFADELARRDVVAAAVGSAEASTGGVWLVMSDSAVEKYGKTAIGFYVSKGLMKRVPDVEGLAEVIVAEGSKSKDSNVVADALETTLDEHDAAAGGRLEDRNGRSSFASGPMLSGPFVVGKIGTALHYTMGGLAIDVQGRVLKEEEESGGAGKKERSNGNGVGENESVVPGLYAAGEAAGGVHGGNRLGGCSLADCVVFGRRAGRAAVEDLFGSLGDR